MDEAAHRLLLKGVSRSFYLSLRLLPAPMRGAASLAYLLARTSDTLADAAEAPLASRVSSLAGFAVAVSTGRPAPVWPAELVAAVEDPREKSLLAATPSLFLWLERLPAREASLIRDVVAVIISGQELDLERFGTMNASRVTALANEAALEDYTWRVAGCVGEFWTRLGFLTLGDRFSIQPQAELVQRGTAYGKGLQLVNILRDMPADLRCGRCYLPVPDVRDAAALHAAREYWTSRARAWIDEGFTYSTALIPRRLRAASMLPALLARDTLALMDSAGTGAMHTRIKVPRKRVYLAILKAFLAP